MLRERMRARECIVIILHVMLLIIHIVFKSSVTDHI